MKRLVSSFIVAVLAGAIPLVARATPTASSDKICPAATAPVREFDKLSKDQNSPVDQVVAAATNLIEIYRQCGLDLQKSGAFATSGLPDQSAKVSTDSGDENLHYTQARQAQFYVVIGRLQRLLGNNGSARDALQSALDLTKGVIDWRAPSQIAVRSNNINSPGGSVRNPMPEHSMYREAAIQIRDAAQAELDKLPKS